MRLLLLAAASAALALSACGPSSNTGEKTGEAMDTQREEATTGDHQMSDGPSENAGEAMDRATEAQAKAAQDAANNQPAPATPATPAH